MPRSAEIITAIDDLKASITGGTPTGSADIIAAIDGIKDTVHAAPPRVVNVMDRQFGAKCDGITDDSAAIQAAIDSLPNAGAPGNRLVSGGVVIVPGPSRVNTTLTVHDEPAAGYKRGVWIMGMNPRSTYPWNSALIWGGAPGSPILSMKTRDSMVSGIRFQVASDYEAESAVEIDKPDAVGIYSSLTFRDLSVYGGGVAGYGRLKYGLFGGRSNASNGEFMAFEGCYFDGMTEASIYVPNTSGQAKQWRFSRCEFRGSPYGQKWQSGSFYTEGCMFQQITEDAIQLTQPTDSIELRSTQCENTKRLFRSMGSTPNAGMVLTIDGGRLNIKDCAEDGFIRWNWAMINIRGVTFTRWNDAIDGAANDRFKINIGTAGVGSTGIVEGCVFPKGLPISNFVSDAQFGTGANGYNGRVICRGNRGYTSATDNGTQVMLDDQTLSWAA